MRRILSHGSNSFTLLTRSILLTISVIGFKYLKETERFKMYQGDYGVASSFRDTVPHLKYFGTGLWAIISNIWLLGKDVDEKHQPQSRNLICKRNWGVRRFKNKVGKKYACLVLSYNYKEANK